MMGLINILAVDPWGGKFQHQLTPWTHIDFFRFDPASLLLFLLPAGHFQDYEMVGFWAVAQAPLILGILLFFFLLLRRRQVSWLRIAVGMVGAFVALMALTNVLIFSMWIDESIKPSFFPLYMPYNALAGLFIIAGVWLFPIYLFPYTDYHGLFFAGILPLFVAMAWVGWRLIRKTRLARHGWWAIPAAYLLMNGILNTICIMGEPIPCKDWLCRMAVSPYGRYVCEWANEQTFNPNSKLNRLIYAMPSQLPEDFWSLPPRDAARAFIEKNRSEWHRKNYDITIQAVPGKAPAESCRLAFKTSRSGWDPLGEVFVDQCYFLRVDPSVSYLVVAIHVGRVALRQPKREPYYDIRILPLEYGKLRHFAHVVWWAKQARDSAHLVWWLKQPSRDYSLFNFRDHGFFKVYGSYITSMADGSASVDYWPNEADFSKSVGHLWGGCSIASRWRSSYGPELVGADFDDHDVYVNLIAYLFADAEALPALAGEKLLDGEHMTYREEGELRKQVVTVLNLFSPDQDAVSHEVVLIAVQAAAELGFAECLPAIVEIRETLQGDPKTAARYLGEWRLPEYVAVLDEACRKLEASYLP